MKRPHLPAISLFLLPLFFFSCSWPGKDFSYTDGGDIWVNHADIKLRIDSNMNVSVFYIKNKTPLNVADKPSYYLVVNDKELTDFSVDYNQLQAEAVEADFGKGKRLIIKGVARTDKETSIEKSLVIEWYERYPNLAILSASYKNTGNLEVFVDRSVSNFFRLDASQSNPQRPAYDFWSYQGASIAWGADYVIHITNRFRQENWMGVNLPQKTGGGVPLVDLWNENIGLAIACIEPKPQLVSLPVETVPDQGVELSIRKDVEKILSPGESYQTVRTAVIAHSLDYFDPLKTFSSLMKDQGVGMKQPSAEAYETIWCGWGYLTDFTLDDIYRTLPKLKELGIKWVVIDDRWWDKYGDWNPRKFTFPGGEEQVKKFVDSLHHQGFKVKIWWAPTPVQPAEINAWSGSVDPGMAQVAKDHPEWLIMDKEGNFPRDSRDMYQFCPSVPEVQEYMKQLTTRFLRDWDFDGHKLDAYYVVPPCYNPAHHHKTPEESYQDLPKLLQVIYETSKSIKPWSVTELCNCGTTQDFYQSVFTDQPVVSDPTSVEQVRRRIKSMKALWGANAPVYGDHVEHIKMREDKSDRFKLGDDFASIMGPGGVIGTKFTWPGGPEHVQLTPGKEEHWKKWTRMYSEKMLSKGDYLNLYDIIYDKPETHVIQKGTRFYYAFYAKKWNGTVELRGLGNRKYKVFDYVNQHKLGTVKGPVGVISVNFEEHLLIECSPLDEGEK
ncbi:MAG: alpha-galactosidase [Prolixibacteraceae bacterium]|jgi:alpha-galactosidase|nr:alpha-galactosidase [Prolixibacteraceae bacterium]